MITRRRETPSSSMILAVGYDAAERALQIEFRNGTTYRYFMVPEVLYDEMISSESVGSFFLERIKPKYPSKPSV